MQSLNNFYQVNAFTNEPFKGNPAAVVLSEELSADIMREIAKHMNFSETAFLSPSDKADYKLRWFTPTLEVELCGHATIASLHYLKEQRKIDNNSRVSFDTLSGIIECEVKNDRYYMRIPVPNFEEYKNLPTEIFQILSLQKDSTDENVPVIVQNNSNIFIYVKSLEILKDIKPDFNALKKICSENRGFTEVTVYTIDTIEQDNDAHLRFFAPYYGIDEDPVTGSVNGPLLLVLEKVGLVKIEDENRIFKFEQGDFVGRPGRIGVTYSDEEKALVISGSAVTMMKGELYF